MLFLPKAILFDHDGVLVASEPLHQQAWAALYEELNIPATPQDIHGGVGTTAPQILKHSLNKYRPGWSEAEYNLQKLTDRKNEIYRSFCPTGLKAYPGVKEGLAWVRASGIQAVIVSNARHKELRHALDLLELSPFFDDVISREDVDAPKPSPAMFELALTRLHLLPEDCLAIDDSPPGLLGALRAGIPSIGVTTNFSKTELERPSNYEPHLTPIAVFTEPAEFFRELKKLADVQ